MARDTVESIANKAKMGNGAENFNYVRKWLFEATIDELLDFISLVGPLSHFHQMAVSFLSRHHANTANESANALIEQTKELHELTKSHVEHSKTLTLQTDTMIKESKKLGTLTWGLLVLTLVLAVLTGALLYIDWSKDNKSEKIVGVETIKNPAK